MPNLVPVNAPNPIPPAPRPHRDKRRKQSGPQPGDERKKREPGEDESRPDKDDTHSIDEYA